MDIAVFLSFCLVFGGNHHTAGAFEQSAIGHWLSGVVLLPKTALGNHRLHLVKQLFSYQGSMFALVLFASVDKMSVVKRIGQNLFDLIWFVDFVAFGFYAVGVKILGNISKTTFVFSVQLKDSYRERSERLVYLYGFVALVVVIAKRRIAGVFAAPDFLAQASLGVLTQVIYIVFALSKGNIEHKLALRGVFKPKGLKL